MTQLPFGSDDSKIQQKKIFNHRLIFAFVFTLVFFLLLILRMGYLQWIEYDHYKNLAEGNRISEEIIPPTRGRIFDRNGQLLAGNRPAFILQFERKKIPNLDQTQQQLHALLPNLPTKRISKFFKRLAHTYHQNPIPLPYTLSEKQAAIFAVNSEHFPGVTLAATLKRYYPYKHIASHVIGYVGQINLKEAQNLSKDRYQGTYIIGKTGMEKQYQSILHGYPGKQKIETNARGRILQTLSTTPDKPGQDIQLSIDIRLQTYIETLLKGQKAAVVVTIPQTGEILAMVSNPGYDLNVFIDGISQKNYNALLHNKSHPLLNRVVNGQYPPGSTIKPFESLGAIEKGIISPYKKIFDPGYFLFKDHRYRDWKKWGHGIVNMSDAIEQSCDTYYYELGLKMGIDNIHDSLAPFGFGQKTGIDFPHEKIGILPSREWKRRIKGKPWYQGETIITAIGQGFFLSTPLQLVQAISILANRGKIIHPHLLKNMPPSPNNYLPIQNSQNWEKVIQAMVKVLHGSKGTARRYARHLPFKMAGKTGTAQVYSLMEDEKYNAKTVRKSLRDHSLFIGFAPVQNPQIAVSVVIENATVKAAPIGIKIAKYYLTQLKNKTLPKAHKPQETQNAH